MSYGVTAEFIHSEDLRFSLVEGKTPNEIQAFEKACAYDSLIEINKKDNKVYYNKEFLNRQKLYINSIRQARAPLSGVHAGCVAVLCGAGWSYNGSLVANAYKQGAIIIAIGSGIRNNLHAQYWAGSCSPMDYPTDLLTKNNLMRFVHYKYFRDRFFDERTRSFRGKQAYEYSGTVLIPEDEFAYKDISGGRDNSLYSGLFLAARLGITDLIFTGIDLEAHPTQGNWYGNDVIINDALRRSKEDKYKHIRKDFTDRVHNLLTTNYGMRMYMDNKGQDIFPTVPLLSEEILLKGISRRSQTGIASRQIKRPGLTMQHRQELAALVEDLEKNALTPANIIEHAEGLLTSIPQVFKIDAIQANIAKYKEYQLNPAGCTSCTKKSLGAHPYRLFLQGMQGQYKADVLAYWEKHMSAYICYKAPGQDYYIAPWKEQLATQYENYIKMI